MSDNTIMIKKPNDTNPLDPYQSPPYVVAAIGKYLQGKVVWEPACGDGNVLKGLNYFEIECFGTDILTGQDFFSYIPDRPYDVIVTNPPFTGRNKIKWLERAYSLGKPFAFLLPITTLQTLDRLSLFQKYGVEIIVLPKQVYFRGGVRDCCLVAAWFTWHLGVEQQLTLFVNSIYDKVQDLIPL